MLELGAGFHPDLTGRDNIRLNGSFLGLGKNIGPALLDEIVAFAEVEEHIDTPVKHYSSGMYARLGFAVAVHSPARVLLVDEVLSVGDKLFRRKCLARMEHLRDQGTTILLVSHDSWAIRNFCGRALVMDQGRLIADTQPEKALQVYEWSLRGFKGVNAPGVSICRIDVLDHGGEPLRFLNGDSLRLCLSYDATHAPQAWSFVVRVRREDGVCCAACVKIGPERRKGMAIAEISGLNLGVGRYVVEASIEDAASLSPLTMEVSAPFQVGGYFDQKRGYDGVIQFLDTWSFH
jgi:lipopolysaccharide transport system ATP-binding protein